MNELTPERLAEIKDRIADYPEAHSSNDDLPLLVAEVERLSGLQKISYARIRCLARKRPLVTDAELDEEIHNINLEEEQWRDAHKDYTASLQSDLSAAQKRIEELEKDSRRLSWILKLIHDKGTNGISDLPWTVIRDDGEDSDVRFGRRTIDAAMHTPPTPP